jgi:hypothetical protein
MPTAPTPDPTGDPLAAALDNLLSEYRRQCAWVAELTAELSSARARLGRTRDAVRAAAALLPPAERARQLATLAEIAGRLGPAKGPRTPLVEAQEAFLALQHDTAFGTPELHAFLSAQGFRLTRSECSKLLARKESQGVLDRVGRGRYRMAG